MTPLAWVLVVLLVVAMGLIGELAVMGVRSDRRAKEAEARVLFERALADGWKVAARLEQLGAEKLRAILRQHDIQVPGEKPETSA